MLQDNLRKLINELGISQRQFAIKIGTDPGYISKILNKKAEPNERLMLLIENIYNVNRNWLETGEGDIFKNTAKVSTKTKILDIINTLDEEQIKSVDAFLKFLKQK